eukprot:gnl/MRDRNA2_/MRDRNA2_36428_c0_seq1.p1 gnl/MRDRNA2_/MRDRNA2_36428_c0~~gnl/MRDRNA2_/MRDRNA2_36428_c0_seq1.p1  ORF type:complete len:109 (+),score=7.14 gnl/MRDRNA2_/MRDRNA2_36428_c0_seq1:1500-1826(+)
MPTENVTWSTSCMNALIQCINSMAIDHLVPLPQEHTTLFQAMEPLIFLCTILHSIPRDDYHLQDSLQACIAPAKSFASPSTAIVSIFKNKLKAKFHYLPYLHAFTAVA